MRGERKTGEPWDEQTFFLEADARSAAGAVGLRRLFDEAMSLAGNLDVVWGKGDVEPRFIIRQGGSSAGDLVSGWRRAVDIPRHCVFAGSTNEETYLRDEENRRFWPMRCSKIDLAALERDRDQLWAEATSRCLRGEPWHVDSAELAVLCRAEQDLRVQTDPWDEMVSQWLGQLLVKRCEASLRGDNCLCVRCKGVTPVKVLTAAIGVEPSRQTKADENRVTAILKRFGWQRGKLARRDGVRIRPFYPPTQETSDGQN